ncbi:MULTISPECIES: hypothetical protein [unclassified Yoonia]|uniref:hypothetical protein n=1 Tax=unclassified Yoonia TaxID=2629118 RepID=UPI002AFF7002|nr:MULTISPECIES: hypothetical protein [unclassified Yoonia]
MDLVLGLTQSLAPFAALCGAIYLYFIKRNDDLRNNEAVRRTELYSRFVSHVLACRMNVAKGLPIGHDSSEVLSSIEFDIRVSCPNNIAAYARELANTVRTIWLLTPEEASASMLNVKFFEQVDKFVALAREDLSTLRPGKFKEAFRNANS